MTSSESEEHAPSRKRSRKSNSAEDDAAGGKKARGRPRVDTHDGTAADRRRTQIRLAQRAYRQRKETTISALKSQSTQLHSIIQQMNKTFSGLNESVLKSGLLQLNPGLAQEFKLVTETFSNLAKTASERQYDGDEEYGEGAENATNNGKVSNTRSQTPPQPEAVPQDIGWGYSTLNPTGRIDSLQPTHTQPDDYFTHPVGALGQLGNTSAIVRRSQFTVGDVLDRSRSSQASPHRESTQSKQPIQLPFGLVDMRDQQPSPFTLPNPHIHSVHIPTPEVTPPSTRLCTPPFQMPNPLSTKTLPPVTTYSFEETTFARRLTRAALETGFQLLSMTSVRPAALNFVYRLSLPYFTLDQLRSRFRGILSRTVDEDLDYWEAPFIHLGGAGTHYPRRDASGNIIPIKNSWTVRQIGPLEKRMARLTHVDNGRWEDLDIDLSGFEGEWFDAHDVQGYLEEEYACKLDPKSSFSECLIDEEEVDEVMLQNDSSIGRISDMPSNSPGLTHSSTATSASSISITPPTNAPSLNDAPFGLDMNFHNAPTPNYPADLSQLANYDISFDQTLGLDLAPRFHSGFSGTAGGWSADMGMGPDMMGENMEVVRQKRKKTAWVDISALINGIIQDGVCLGRAPGFRRKDVDIAVRKALIPAC